MLSRSRFFAVVVLFLLSFGTIIKAVRADVGVCPTTVYPSTVGSGSQVNFQFNITNSDPSTPIKWILITSPSGGDALVSASATGWDASVDPSSGANFNNGTLNPSDSLNMNILTQIGPNEIGTANWGIYAFDGNGNGGNDPGNLVCQDTPTLDISDATPHISGVSVGSISSSSVTISWATSLPASSKVNYGLSDSYGASTANANLTTNHSVVVKNLEPNTGYHYQVTGTTAAGASDTSGDGTFLTAIEQAPGTTVTQTITIPITNPGDKTPPTISLTGTLPHIVKQIPVINGVAKDDQAVMAVQYSTDSGQNWLLVDSTPGLGSKQVNFSFTPVNLDDGNYQIIVRAIDGGGNIASTTPVTVVVDRLPPLVGGALISLGPQILTPDSNNVITTLAGIDQKITMSAVGGPTSITIDATQVGSKINKEKAFNLTQDVNSGLWSGILSFQQAGVYSLIADSIDGAGNKTSHQLNTINVSSVARVVAQGTNKSLKAQLKLYTYDSDTSGWIVWDGSPFSQTNPQTTGTNGAFKLFLPPGKYYLAVTANGYKPLVSNIFNLQQTTPLTTQLDMKKVDGFKLGPVHISWPSLSSQAIDINPTVPKVAQGVNPNKLINKSFPNLTLSGTNGSNTSSISWLGRPTLLSFMVSWLPSTSEQLNALSQLQTNKDINIVPIALQENADKMRVYTQTAGYSLNWLVDPDSTLTNVVNIQSLPTHYFINRDGVVKKVITGILSKQQILDNLSSLQ
jgi:hypothetical protein